MRAALTRSIIVATSSSVLACLSQTALARKSEVVEVQRGKTADVTPKRNSRPVRALRDSLFLLGPFGVLVAPAVQEELGMSKEQRDALAALRETYQQRSGEYLMEFGRQFHRHSPKFREAMAGAQLALRLEKWRDLDTILTRAQRKRLVEIALQTEGPLAAVWPEIHAQLGIHPGQQPLLAEVEAQLRSGFSTYSRSMTDIVYGPDRRASGPVSPEEMQEKIAGHAEQFERLYADFEANRERAVKEVTRILTRRQKDRLNQMMGEPYDVSDLQLPGGGNWQPKDAERYWAQREAERAKAEKEATDADTPLDSSKLEPEDEGGQPE